MIAIEQPQSAVVDDTDIGKIVSLDHDERRPIVVLVPDSLRRPIVRQHGRHMAFVVAAVQIDANATLAQTLGDPLGREGRGIQAGKRGPYAGGGPRKPDKGG